MNNFIMKIIKSNKIINPIFPNMEYKLYSKYIENDIQWINIINDISTIGKRINLQKAYFSNFIIIFCIFTIIILLLFKWVGSL
jgi:hypothetical protein